MNHQTDTPASFSNVPGHTRLFRREPGGTYYLRAKVPLPIRPIVGKTEIRVSLKTKDLKEGKLRVKPESMRVDRLFAEAEAKLKGETPTPAKLSREELAWVVADWFVKQEAASEQWVEDEGATLGYSERKDIAEDLRTDCTVLNGNPDYDGDGGREYLLGFLQGEGAHLGIEPGSEDFKRLLPLFRKAVSENLMRQADRVLERPQRPYDPRFADYHASTLLPPPPWLATSASGTWRLPRLDVTTPASPANGGLRKVPRRFHGLSAPGAYRNDAAGVCDCLTLPFCEAYLPARRGRSSTEQPGKSLQN